MDLSTRSVGVFLGYLYCGGLDEAKENSELAVEILKAAGVYDVPNLWKEIGGIFMEKDVDVKTAFAIFKIIAKSGKLGSTMDLASKMFAKMNA